MGFSSFWRRARQRVCPQDACGGLFVFSCWAAAPPPLVCVCVHVFLCVSLLCVISVYCGGGEFLYKVGA